MRRTAAIVAAMLTWSDFEAAAPDLAREVRERLDAHTHKTIATLRADGSPRISGTETAWAEGDLWIGSMWQARKARDLQRDARFALHGGSDDPPGWTGDAKIAGRAEEIIDEARVNDVNGIDLAPSHLFRLDIAEVSLVALNEAENGIVIESWKPGEPVRTLERR